MYRIKGILFSILSLSGPLSGKPDIAAKKKNSNILMIFVCKLPINKIKGYLYSILSLSGHSSG
jgi:hypothetical protein